MANKRQRKKNKQKEFQEEIGNEPLKNINTDAIKKDPNLLVDELESFWANFNKLSNATLPDEFKYSIYSSIIQQIDNVVNMPKPRKERAIKAPELPKFPRHIIYKDEPPIDEELPIYTSDDLKPRPYFFVPPEIDELELDELFEQDEEYAMQYLKKYEGYSRYVIEAMRRHTETGLGRATNYQMKGMYKIAMQNGSFERYVKDKWEDNKDQSLEQIQASYSEEILEMLEEEVDEYETQKGDNAFNALQEAEKVLEQLNREAIDDVRTRYNNNKGRIN